MLGSTKPTINYVRTTGFKQRTSSFFRWQFDLRQQYNTYVIGVLRFADFHADGAVSQEVSRTGSISREVSRTGSISHRKYLISRRVPLRTEK
jgi:hypothetical protein